MKTGCVAHHHRLLRLESIRNINSKPKPTEKPATPSASGTMSNIEQPVNSSACNSCRMSGEIQIQAVELDGSDGLVVTFSDGTTGGYVVEELLQLRPVRERVKIRKSHKVPITKVQP